MELFLLLALALIYIAISSGPAQGPTRRGEETGPEARPRGQVTAEFIDGVATADPETIERHRREARVGSEISHLSA
jgi:hypothetical protein